MSARAALYLAMVLPCLPGVAHARAPKPAVSQQAATPAVEAQTQWYYAVDGRTVGPIDDKALVDAYLLGQVTDATSVWWEGAQGWVPLADAPRFVELDRWYVRNGDKGLGPMTGAALRASLAQATAKGKAIAMLEVRLEWSPWVPVAKAAPLNEQPAPAKWEPDTARTAAVAVTLASPVEAPSSTPTYTPTSTAPMRDTEPPTPAAGDSDALADAMRLRKAGLITLGVGAGLIAVGGGIAGGYTSGVVGARGLWVGVGLAAAGVLPTIAGMAMFSTGNRRARNSQRLASLRLAPLAGRGNGGVVFAGRF